jgi:hypothetical protein
MYSDEFKRQLPDVDPAETQDWIDSFDQVIDQQGMERARLGRAFLRVGSFSGRLPSVTAMIWPSEACSSR